MVDFAAVAVGCVAVGYAAAGRFEAVDLQIEVDDGVDFRVVGVDRD